MKKYTVITSDSAHEDLNDIYAWIAYDAPLNAARFYSRLADAILSLEEFPFRGSPAPEAALAGKDIRQLVIGYYRILFLVREDQVFVLHVRHGARKPISPEDM